MLKLQVVTFVTHSHGVLVVPTIAEDTIEAIQSASRMIPFVTSAWTATAVGTGSEYADLINDLNEAAYDKLCDLCDGNDYVDDDQYEAGLENYHLVADTIWHELSENN